MSLSVLFAPVEDVVTQVQLQSLVAVLHGQYGVAGACIDIVIEAEAEIKSYVYPSPVIVGI